MIRATVCSEAASPLSESLLVSGSRNCVGVRNPSRTCRQHRRSQRRLRLDRPLNHHFPYSFAKRFVSPRRSESSSSAFVPAVLPYNGCARPLIGIRPAGVQLSWKGNVCPERKRAIPRRRNAGEHRIRIHVHALDQICNCSAPARMLSAAKIRSDRLPCRRLVESAKRAEEESGRGITELAFTCALVAGTISVPVFATIARRPALNRFCTPASEGLSPNVRPLCGVFSVIGNRSARGYASPGAPDRAAANAAYVSLNPWPITVPWPSLPPCRKNAYQCLVIRGAGALRHRCHRVEPDKKWARRDPRHRGKRCRSQKLPTCMVMLAHSGAPYCCAV